MKLKRLDIHGFKSFYHRTTISFDDGITGVVGPNGCGKSNVVDAIKWVMGEQGARTLRGGAMDDVVFAGSERRGALGISEVRLTFDNDGSIEVPAPWRDVAEIAVERRLERTKGSEYFINKKRCRLADVVDLVAGTGVGSGRGQRAYAIIEQGRIGQIVGARADERRLLIEEAAGVTRYRARRTLAERKMKDTRGHLERVDDIVGEVGRQLQSLRRQARKAERFTEYRVEAKTIALRVAAEEIATIRTALEAAGALLEQRLAEERDRQVNLEAAETNRVALEVAAETAKGRAAEVADGLRRAEETVRLTESRLEACSREREGLVAQETRAKRDLSVGETRLATLAKEIEEGQSNAAALQSSADAAASALATADERRESAARAVLDARARVEGLKREDAEEMARVAQARADVALAQARIRDATARLTALAEEHTAHLLAVDTLGSKMAAQAQAAKGAQVAVADAEAATVQARGEIEAAGGGRRTAERRERDAREQLIGVRSRLESLRELEARREDLGEAARALLESGLDGVVGAVPELFTVDAEFEDAVTAALGARIKGVVAEDAATARRALDFLEDNEHGRALVVALAGAEGPPTKPVDVDGVVGVLADLIGASPLASMLLDGAVLVADLDAAEALVRGGHRGLVVTRSGVTVHDGALWTGGGVGPDSSPLRRRREIRDLEAREAELATEVTHLAEVLTAACDAEARAREALEAGLEAARRAAALAAEAGRAKEALDAESTQLSTRGADITAQRIAFEAARERDEVAAKTAEEAVKVAEAAQSDRRKAIAEAGALAADAEGKREAAVGAFHEAKTAAATVTERIASGRALLSRLRRQTEDIEQRMTVAKTVGVEIGDEFQTLAERETAERKRGEEAQGLAAEKAADLAEARAASDLAVVASLGGRETVQGAREVAKSARDAVGEARLAQERSVVQLEGLQMRVTERFQMTLDALAQQCAEAPPLEALDRARLAQLESLIDRIGEVHLGAVQECREAEERHGFLEGQRDDLLAGLADLEGAIAEMNRESRRLFAETFEIVNGHFQRIFPRLFRGGSAELVLTDPTNLLETGVEMHVSPPGKKVQNVTLLSGGEKAMCALALIFAVFHFKPSPFCLLDEVDAPLDDANIGRFNEVIREMAHGSQVVLVTHNKRTMEIADALYGVTMEEPGVSKLVGVKMT